MGVADAFAGTGADGPGLAVLDAGKTAMSPADPTRFPGCIYDPQGKRLDCPGPDMTQEQLDEHLHQTLLADRDGAGVSRVWLLADDASADALPAGVVAEAVRLMLSGEGFLIAARRPEVEVAVRERLLQAMDAFVALPDTPDKLA